MPFEYRVRAEIRVIMMFAAIGIASPRRHGVAQFPRVRDSAGVHIVENSARAKAPIAFQLSAKPSYDIGGLKDNPDDELYKNTVYLQYLRLTDGRYVVGDQIRVRFFDATGKQLRVVGRQGRGPGEFQYIAELCRTRGDSIVVNDPGNGRVTVFDKSGTMLNELPVGRTDIPREGCFADGTWLLAESVRPASGPTTTRLVRRRLDGTVVDTVGEFWGGVRDLFISIQASFAANGNHLYVGDPRSSDVRIYDVQGKLTGIVRTTDPIVKTTASEQAAMEPLIGVATDDPAIRARFAERLRTSPRPTEWPSYGRIALDPDGRLWIEDFQRDRKAPVVWTGFDQAGKMLGKLSMPAWVKPGDPRILSFTAGGVVVLHDDDDGSPHLSTYALVPVKSGKP